MVARRRRDGVRARERAYRLYRRRGKRAGAARMATWLAADQLDFHGAVAVARGWLGAPTGCSIRSSRGRSTAGCAFHDGYIAQAGGDPRARRARRSPPSSGGGSTSPISRCSGSRSRGRRSSPLRRSTKACAIWTRRRRPRWRARRDPDLGRLGLLLPGLRLHGRARLRARLRMVRPDRRVRGALREPLHARLLPGRVRRGASLAGTVGRSGGRCWRLRSRTFALAAALGGRLLWSRWPS